MARRRIVLSLMAAGLLASCTKTPEKPKVPQAEGEVTEANPLGVKNDAELEVILFSGGYGTQFATAAHIPAYQKLFPKANIKFAAIEEMTVLAPRFAGENQPDLVNNAGPKPLNMPALIAGEQIADLTDLLKAPAAVLPDPSGKSPKPDKPVTVEETLIPGAVVTFDDKPYAINYTYVVYGLWYSGKQFRDRGWSVPVTWPDFIGLLEQMQGAGVTPYAYAGVDGAMHQIQAMLTTAAKIGGAEVLWALDKLTDGAWRHDAIRQAAALWADVGSRFLDKGHFASTRAKVQALQAQGRVGFYPSGSWLEHEQAKIVPPGFDYRAAILPSVSPEDKAAAVLAEPGNLFFVSANGKNSRGAKEYLRQMLSAEGARKFTELTGSPTVVKESPAGSATVSALLKDAETVSYRWPELYPGLAYECQEATNDLMFQGGSAEAFCERMQKAADAAKK